MNQSNSLSDSYIVSIADRRYLAVNGIHANVGDKVAYEWNPNDEINEVVRKGPTLLYTESGCGDREKFHKIINHIN